MSSRPRMLSALALLVALPGCSYLGLQRGPEAAPSTAQVPPPGPGKEASQPRPQAVPEPSLREIARELGQPVDDEALPVANQPETGEGPDADPPLAGPTASLRSPSADLWSLTRANFQLARETDHPRVTAQLNWYARHPRYLDRVTDRARRYYHHVLHEVLKRKLPAEFALLPIVESAYDPFAYSHGRAAGPWQFIPGTARHFGLKKSWWYDGRRDILDSTDAALTYLEQLSRRFDGDWLLALAAYNAGGGNVNKAIRKNRRQGKPTDFWSLDLPKETESYVPKLIALAKIFEQPEAYDISLDPLPNRPYFEVVETGSQIDLAQAAELAGIDANELYLLNPGFNQWATDPDGPHRLLIPAERAEPFRRALATMPEAQRVGWRRYRVKSGDSLIVIAKRFHTTPQVVRQVNGIRGSLIRSGQTLMIPTAAHDAKLYTLSAPQRQASKNRRIALRSDKQKATYTVRRGDSFWAIAKRYGVGTRELARWNQMAPGDPLRVGKKLVVWLPQKGDTRLAANSRSVVRKIGYRVRSGDSLALIANRFNVSLNELKKWNHQAASAKYLQPGQRLTLYVDVTESR